MIHVVLVCVINEVAPLTTFGCKLVEEGFGAVAAGAALEMDDLILAVSRASGRYRNFKNSPCHHRS